MVPILSRHYARAVVVGLRLQLSYWLMLLMLHNCYCTVVAALMADDVAGDLVEVADVHDGVKEVVVVVVVTVAVVVDVDGVDDADDADDVVDGYCYLGYVAHWTKQNMTNFLWEFFGDRMMIRLTRKMCWWRKQWC